MNSSVARDDQAAAGFRKQQNTKRPLILSTGKMFLLEDSTPEQPDRVPAIGNTPVSTVAGVMRRQRLSERFEQMLQSAL